jgi:hypothetical protein
VNLCARMCSLKLARDSGFRTCWRPTGEAIALQSCQLFMTRINRCSRSELHSAGQFMQICGRLLTASAQTVLWVPSPPSSSTSPSTSGYICCRRLLGCATAAFSSFKMTSVGRVRWGAAVGQQRCSTPTPSIPTQHRGEQIRGPFMWPCSTYHTVGAQHRWHNQLGAHTGGAACRRSDSSPSFMAGLRHLGHGGAKAKAVAAASHEAGELPKPAQHPAHGNHGIRTADDRQQRFAMASEATAATPQEKRPEATRSPVAAKRGKAKDTGSRIRNAISLPTKLPSVALPHTADSDASGVVAPATGLFDEAGGGSTGSSAKKGSRRSTLGQRTNGRRSASHSPPLPATTAIKAPASAPAPVAVTMRSLLAQQPVLGHAAWSKRLWVVFSDLHVQEKSLETCLKVWREIR